MSPCLQCGKEDESVKARRGRFYYCDDCEIKSSVDVLLYRAAMINRLIKIRTHGAKDENDQRFIDAIEKGELII